MKKRIIRFVGFAIIACFTCGVIYINSLLPIITGYSSKYLCSAVFISNRIPGDVEAADLRFSFVQYVKNTVDYKNKSVTSRFLWGHSKSIYRDGFGSTLLRDVDEVVLREIKFPFLTIANYSQDTIAWPLGNIIPENNTGIDKTALNNITDKLMIHKSYNGNAYAFLVIHKGIPVAEQYKPEFNAKTRFLSWSMAKSFTNALASIMVKDGKLDIQKPADISDWQKDDRKKITINNLMQMQSGLQWNEDYGNRSDVTLMLYVKKDFAGYALKKPLEFRAGSHWYYSSGSANIVNYLLRKQFKEDSAYYTYAFTRLFNKIGMPNAIFEVDPAGTQVGSSYIYATARDYARFGLLYLHDGIFNGERILPEGWVSYTTTPSAHSNGGYGSFFWLNKGKYYPSAPEDMYSCNGHNGQRIFIIPSKDLVVVVIGYSPKPEGGMNFDLLLKDILRTISN